MTKVKLFDGGVPRHTLEDGTVMCAEDCSLHIVRPGKTQCNHDSASCPNKAGHAHMNLWNASNDQTGWLQQVMREACDVIIGQEQRINQLEGELNE